MFPLSIVVILCMMLFSTGIALLLSITYINFDDSKSLIGILLMSLQYVTPVFYPLSAIGPHTRKVIELNPLTSYLQCFRSVFGGNALASTKEWVVMFVSAGTMFLFGLFIFQRQWPKVVSKL